MSKLTIDANSRLVSAADLGFTKRAGAGRQPIDFARDHVVILDPATNRPVAECWPVEREPGAPEPRPVLAGAPSARAQAPAPGSTSAVGEGMKGPLTEPQREMLTRLWRENPKATVDKIGEEFERRTGRSVGAITVLKYRDEAKGTGKGGGG